MAGDKWVPWHTVLCEHEIYIHGTIKRLPVSDEERLRLVFAFSASRFVPLFDSVLLPFHRELLDDTAHATRRDGELHQVSVVPTPCAGCCLALDRQLRYQLSAGNAVACLRRSDTGVLAAIASLA